MCVLVGPQSLSSDIIQGRRQYIYFGTINLICSGFSQKCEIGVMVWGFWSKISERGRLGGRGKSAPSQGSTGSASPSL